MALLSPDAFQSVFEPLQGKRIGYVCTPGNVGDRMIEAATFQLLRHFEIDFVVADPRNSTAVDEWLVFGGGNMGTRYPIARRLREQVLATGLPVIVLPQSFTGPENLIYHRVYVREMASFALCPEGVLAPDLALGLVARVEGQPDLGVGLWLRGDSEALFRSYRSRGDPVVQCRTPQQYLILAARHRRVVTDRLHFVIAALLCGRQATLLPNSYYKNRAMYDTWLKQLGCDWQDQP